MRRPMCWIAALFLLALLVFLHIFSIVPEDYDRLKSVQNEEKVSVCGTVWDLKTGDDSIVCTLKNVSVNKVFSGSKETLTEEDANKNGRYGILVYLQPGRVQTLPKISSVLSCTGTFHKFRAAENEGQFHSAGYYYLKGLDGYLTEPDDLCSSRSYGRLRHGLFLLRARIREICTAYLNEQDAGVMTALLTGDRSILDQETKELYQNAGIAHILSLSGLHVAALGIGMYRLLCAFIRKAFAKKRICADLHTGGARSSALSLIFCGLVLFLFCLMTGTAVSTIRALIMFLLAGISDLKGRTYDLLSSAAFASIVVCVIDPLSILDAGFQLSFAAVASIGILYPQLTACCSLASKSRILQGLLLSLSIQLGTLPVVSWHYHQISLCGIFLNLLVVPLMGVILASGCMLVLFGLICAAPFLHVFEGICRIPAFITHVILFVYDGCAGAATSVPGSIRITGKPEAVQVAVYYAVIFLAVLIRERKSSLCAETGRGKREKRIDFTGRHNIVLEGKIRKCLKPLIFCGLLIIACVIISIRPRELLEVRNLSVGQGDCALVFNKTHVILIDCGSTSENGVGKYKLIPCLKANAVTSIDDLIISHFDSDHVNGILELMDDPVYRHRIKRVILSCQAPVQDAESENYRRFLRLSARNSIPVYLMHAGESLREGTLELLCVSPDSGISYADTNAASLVLLVRETTTGFSAMFTGDIDENTEAQILADHEKSLDSIRYYYLKAAHHGARTSSSALFLDALLNKNGFVVISCGLHNRYHHPHPETMDRFGAYPNLHILRTDRSGEIILKYDGKRVRCESFCKALE